MLHVGADVSQTVRVSLCHSLGAMERSYAAFLAEVHTTSSDISCFLVIYVFATVFALRVSLRGTIGVAGHQPGPR